MFKNIKFFFNLKGRFSWYLGKGTEEIKRIKCNVRLEFVFYIEGRI